MGCKEQYDARPINPARVPKHENNQLPWHFSKAEVNPKSPPYKETIWLHLKGIISRITNKVILKVSRPKYFRVSFQMLKISIKPLQPTNY